MLVTKHCNSENEQWSEYGIMVILGCALKGSDPTPQCRLVGMMIETSPCRSIHLSTLKDLIIIAWSSIQGVYLCGVISLMSTTCTLVTSQSVVNTLGSCSTRKISIRSGDTLSHTLHCWATLVTVSQSEMLPNQWWI